MKRLIIDLSPEETKELRKIDFENRSRWTIIQMLLNTQPQNKEMAEKFIAEYMEAQTKAEFIRQDVLMNHKPDATIARFSVDIVNNNLVVMVGDDA